MADLGSPRDRGHVLAAGRRRLVEPDHGLRAGCGDDPRLPARHPTGRRRHQPGRSDPDRDRDGRRGRVVHRRCAARGNRLRRGCRPHRGRADGSEDLPRSRVGDVDDVRVREPGRGTRRRIGRRAQPGAASLPHLLLPRERRDLGSHRLPATGARQGVSAPTRAGRRRRPPRPGTRPPASAGCSRRERSPS